jgi:hypothetical protein
LQVLARENLREGTARIVRQSLRSWPPQTGNRILRARNTLRRSCRLILPLAPFTGALICVAREELAYRLMQLFYSAGAGWWFSQKPQPLLGGDSERPIA